MTKKALFPVLILLGFFIGGYSWQVLSTRQSHDRLLSLQNKIDKGEESTLVNVDKASVDKEDIDFEFRVLTMNLKDDDISAIPDNSQTFSKKEENPLSPLRENIINSLVERKMLFQIIRRDDSFSLKDSERYVSCVKNWMRSVSANKELFKNTRDQERLKSRLCEQSILRQYLDEKIFNSIKITEKQVLDY